MVSHYHHSYFALPFIPLTEQLNKLNTGYDEHTTNIKILPLL